MDRIKVCHVSDTLPGSHSRWGGAEQACRRIMDMQFDEGLDLFAITSRPDSSVAYGNIRIFSVPVLDGLRALKQMLIPFDPLSFLPLCRILSSERPDIVHLHRVNIISLSAALAARLLQIPVVVSIYDYYYFCPKETMVDGNGNRCNSFHGGGCASCMALPNNSALKRTAISRRRGSFDFFLRGAFYHVLSGASAAVLSSYGIRRERVFTIPQVLSLPGGSTAPWEKGKILFIGTLQERKGLHLLIDAMPEIIRECPQAHLVAVGPGYNDAYSEKIRDRIDALGLTERVALLGMADHTLVNRHMDEANAVAIPEQWENMSPVVLFEAMAKGKAVVASRVGGIPEFLCEGETGFLADPSSPKEFASKLTKLLRNDEEAKRVGKSAQWYMKEFMDKKRIMGEYRAMYERITGGDHD
jgi:glycosyltransferase involved in cell wall biosynthesis